jgi:short-subunit dehydrogenase
MKGWTLLTGASTGIGYEYAYILAQNNHNLILVARSEDKLSSLKKDLEEKFDTNCFILPIDLTAEDALTKINDLITSNNLEIDYLINNAGIGQFDYFHKISDEKLDTMLKLNMNVPTELTKMILPKLIVKNSGGIQFIASIASYLPTPLYCNYGATKAYLRHFGTSLHYELSHTNIKVNVFNPGVTKTDFFTKADQKNSLSQRLQMMSAKRCATLAYKALMSNKSTSLPGFLNNLTVYILLKFTPIFLQAKVIMKDLLKDNARKF